MSGDGEVSLKETRRGAKPGIVDLPQLVEMKPALNTTDEFDYVFSVRVKGSPVRAGKIVGDKAAELIASLPDGLQDAFLQSYQALSAATVSAKDYEKKAQEENRRLMAAVDQAESLNEAARQARKEAEDEKAALEATRAGWRTRIANVAEQKAEAKTAFLRAELRETQERAASAERKAEAVRSALRLIGSVMFEGVDLG